MLAPLAAIGCVPPSSGGGGGGGTAAASEALASDGAEVSAASAQAMHLDSVVFSSVSSADPAKATEQASASDAVWPPGCVSREKIAPNQVEVTFADCTGPFGLVHLDGDEIATFSAGASPGVLHVDVASSNLSANGKSIDHHASADLTFPSATEIDVAWKGGWSHVTSDGRDVEHASDLSIVVDLASSCVTANGSGDTTVDGRGVSSDIQDYQVCGGASGDACPTGAIDLKADESGAELTIQFDGSSDAEVTAGSRDFSVPLVCGG
ncbi:MAG TPA: hypothetical protein VHB21_02905 [Minicystis sp.]|nr:hypothetical protein [Minicystis sp.]